MREEKKNKEKKDEKVSKKEEAKVEVDKKTEELRPAKAILRVGKNGETEKQEEVKDKKESSKDELKTVVVKGKKKKKIAPFLRGGRGQVHIKATYNNTIITITDLNGSVLIWSSAGKCGFKGPKKSTPYAAGVIVKSMVEKVKELGIKELDAFVKGVGIGREAAIRAFDTHGLRIVSIKDVTSIPHGGCRPKKRRRV